jgi:16S rRNA (guanine527-N7)-methyltransferase
MVTNSKYTAPLALIRRSLKPYGIRPSPAQAEAIQRYLALLLQWNHKVSLTSLLDPAEILQRHFGECMFAASAVPISSGRLADVGSGAGFPGLALKIACPELELILIESNVRKSAFLSEVVRSLNLDGVEVVRSRMEGLSVREGFAGFVSARAVGNFDRILRWARKALSEEGQVLLWLGAADAEEVSLRHGWRWRELIKIPCSHRRVLLIGRPSPS